MTRKEFNELQSGDIIKGHYDNHNYFVLYSTNDPYLMYRILLEDSLGQLGWASDPNSWVLVRKRNHKIIRLGVPND